MRCARCLHPIAVLAVLTAVAATRRAEACSTLVEIARLNGETAPAGGASDVPTNARIFFAASDGLLEGVATATLQRGDDEPLSAAVEPVPGGFVLANAALEPDTTYTAILDLLGQADGDAALDQGVRGELVFTTGDAVDATAPLWDGDATLSVEHVPGSGLLETLFPSTCGVRSAFDVHTVTAPGVDDDVAVIELAIVRPDATTMVVDAGPPGTALVARRDAGDGPGRYQLVAIDVAGNRSESLPIAASGISGCSAGGGGEAGIVASVLAGLSWRRRRRR